MANIYKFSNQLRNNIQNEDVKKISFVIDDLMTKYLDSKAKVNPVVKETIAKAFSGKGVFETVSEERQNDSIELLNNKVTAALFSKAMKQYDPDKVVKFDVEGGTFLPDASTKNLMKNPSIWKSQVFRDIFMTNYQNAITPAAYSIMVGFYDNLAQIHTCDFGDNIAFTVESNEILIVQPLGQDTMKLSSQTLKKKDYIATPVPHGARVSINFYDMAAGKLNWAEHIMKVARGFAHRFNQAKIEVLYNYVADATTNFTVNTPFFKVSLNDANWNSVVKAIGTANSNENVVAYGDLDAVGQILPMTATAGMNEALASALGKEWTANGYIGEYHGASVNKLPQSFLPGTINASGTEAVFGAPEDIIYFVNEGVKPLHVAIEGGTLYVDKDYMETGDTTLDYTIIGNFEVIYVPGDKIGAIHIAAA